MSDSVLSHLESTKPAIVARLDANQDIANMFMGLLANMILACANGGTPIEGVVLSAPTIDANLIKARVTFHDAVIGTPAVLGIDTSDFGAYARSKAAGMARAMARNQEFSKFFVAVLELIEKYCAFKGRAFSGVIFDKTFIDRDGMLVLEIGQRGVLPS